MSSCSHTTLVQLLLSFPQSIGQLFPLYQLLLPIQVYRYGLILNGYRNVQRFFRRSRSSHFLRFLLVYHTFQLCRHKIFCPLGFLFQCKHTSCCREYNSTRSNLILKHVCKEYKISWHCVVCLSRFFFHEDMALSTLS